jgi:glutathione S-transferase
MMKLYNFFRSGTSHRLRIALNIKGLAYEYVPVDLRTEQHLGAEYKALNPQGLVPALVDDGRVLIQSPAIIEWLEVSSVSVTRPRSPMSTWSRRRKVPVASRWTWRVGPG